MNAVEQGGETMSPRDAFQTQFSPDLPIILQRTTCGIASLYGGLKYLGYDLKPYPSFVAEYISSGTFDVPTHYLQGQIGKQWIDIPVDYYPEEKPGDLEKTNRLVDSLGNNTTQTIKREFNHDHEKQMAFTIAKGFDHRGVNPFLQKISLPLEAELVENSNLPDSLEPESFILASVRHNDLGYPASAKIPTEHISTHIVTILQIGRIGNTDVVLFMDPAFIDPGDSIQIRSLEMMRSCTQKFTYIRPKDNNSF